MTKIEAGDYDIHINFPGGIPIDGPSAGISMAIAIYSALTGKPVDNTVAMTGEVSIRGLIKPVGGVSSKIEAARQAGAKKVLIPKDNWQNLFQNYENTEVIPIETLEEAIGEAVKVKEEEKIQLVTADSLMTIS
jgi:Lon-like ATP-dependent protease